MSKMKRIMSIFLATMLIATNVLPTATILAANDETRPSPVGEPEEEMEEEIEIPAEPEEVPAKVVDVAVDANENKSSEEKTDSADAGINTIDFDVNGDGGKDSIEILNPETKPEYINDGKWGDFSAEITNPVDGENIKGHMIDWTILVNPNHVRLEKMEVTDFLPDGLIIYDYEVTYAEDGSAADALWNFQRKDPSNAGGEVSWTYNGPSTDQAFEFHIMSVVADMSKFSVEGTMMLYFVENWTKLKYQVPGSTEKEIKIGTGLAYGGKMIDKTGAIYSVTRDYLRWNLKVNRRGQTLENVKIIDEMDDGQAFAFSYRQFSSEDEQGVFKWIAPDSFGITDENSSKVKRLPVLEFFETSYQGNEIGGPLDWQEGRDYFLTYKDGEHDNLTIEFPEITIPIKISLYSYYGDMNDAGKPQGAKNTATMAWDNDDAWGFPSEGKTDVGEIEGDFNLLTKENSAYDPLTQTITWEVIANYNQVVLDNAVLYEVIGKGQELIGNASDDWGIEIYETRTAASEEPLGFTYSNKLDKSKYDVHALTLGDIDASWGFEGDSGVKINFIGPDELEGEEYELNQLVTKKYILIKTKVTDSKVLETNQTETYHNDVALTAEQIEGAMTDCWEQEVKYFGSVQLLKTDGAGTTVLADAYFDLYKEGKTTAIQTGLSSNASGIIEVKGLEEGSYYFVETKAPNGYVINAEKIGFEIKAENGKQVVTVDHKNEREPEPEYEIDVEKRDKDSDAQLSETAFILSRGADATTEYYQVDTTVAPHEVSWTTDEDEATVLNGPNFTLKQLVAGVYTLTETEVKPGYIDQDLVATITIADDGVITVSDNDDGEMAVVAASKARTILKLYNKEKPELLGSVQLLKTDSEGNGLAGAIFDLYKEGELFETDLESDEDGMVEVTELETGAYYFVETEAPVEYELDETPIDFDIETSREVEPEVVTVSHKNELKPELLGTVQLLKTDSEGNGLAGASFDLYKEGELFEKDLESDEDGMVEVTELETGSYYFVETEAPVEYELDETPIDFEIETSREVEPEVVMVSHKNELKPELLGTVQLLKTDSEGNSLAGASFDLYKEGELFETDLESDEDGMVEVTELETGSYYFVETEAPVEYELDETPIDFEIETSREVEPEVVTVSHKNELKPELLGTVQLLKTDSEGKALAGASFDLHKDGELFKSDLVSDENGMVEVKELAAGEYYFVETKAPAGYVLDITAITFTIETSREQEPEVVTVSHKNELIPEEITELGSVQLLKTDEKGKALAGAIFDLYKEGDKKAMVSDLTSDKNGMIEVKELEPGKYYFIETKAPKGYVLDATPITFEITEAAIGTSELVKVTFVNELIPADSKKPTTTQKTTSKTTAKSSKVVKTGDVSGIVFYGVILVIAAALIVAVAVVKKKKNQKISK